ncbi:MAG TPA: hypothetical protein VLA49_10370 [Anaerolineales bacterium]|nr:hypothetical protein [Anaerolineales bacterium]
MQQLINDQEFIRGAALLIMGAIVTGLTVPALKLILDNLNFRKQKLFEDHLARQNSIVAAQIKFLDHLGELLWEFHALIARVSYYKSMESDDPETRKRTAAAVTDYENRLWDILIIQIQSEISKSRRLASSPIHQKLAALYKHVLVELDGQLVDLLKKDAPREVWDDFHKEKLKKDLVREIDEILQLLAEDMGLTRAVSNEALVKK